MKIRFYRGVIGVLLGFCSLCFITKTTNFALYLKAGVSGTTNSIAMIIWPKFIFSLYLGLSTYLVKVTKSLKNFFLCISVFVFSILFYQTIEIWLNIDMIAELSASVNTTRGTLFVFNILLFITILLIIDWLFFKEKFFKYAIYDCALIGISTVIFYLPRWIFHYGITPLFLVGFQIGGFFALYNIVLPIMEYYFGKGQNFLFKKF